MAKKTGKTTTTTKTRNAFEQRIENQLKLSKVPFSYESCTIPYVLARHYIPDFVLATRAGYIYIETKGYLRREDKAKLSAVKKQNPSKDIRIIFYRSTPSYIKWAEKNGFKYHIGRVPEEWLNE